MKLRKWMSAGIGLLGGLLAAPAAWAVFALPPGYVTYGDAQSYALQVSGTLIGCTGPGCPYYVNSTPGAIKDLTVIGTGADGKPVTTNYPGADDSYPTPNSDGIVYFETGGYTTTACGGTTCPAPDPGGFGPSSGTANDDNFTHGYNDTGKSWDVELNALKTFLNGEQMIIFFNNNQTNSGPDTNQTLAAWAVLWLTGPDGVVVSNSIYELSNRGQQYGGPGIGGGVLSTVNPNAASSFTSTVTAPQTDRPGTKLNTGPYAQICFVSSTQSVELRAMDTGCQTGEHFLGTTEKTDYVLSGGPVCINSAETALVPCGTTDSKVVNNNLGANQAAYALLFPELNTQLTGFFNGAADLSQYSLHIRVLLGCDPEYSGAECTAKSLNNGYEQIFITTASSVVQVPEPGSTALLALGMLGVAFAMRRKAARA